LTENDRWLKKLRREKRKKKTHMKR
jgi:hypothetical protein